MLDKENLIHRSQFRRNRREIHPARKTPSLPVAAAEKPRDSHQRHGANHRRRKAADKSIRGNIQLRENPPADHRAHQSQNNIRQASESMPRAKPIPRSIPPAAPAKSTKAIRTTAKNTPRNRAAAPSIQVTSRSLLKFNRMIQSRIERFRFFAHSVRAAGKFTFLFSISLVCTINGAHERTHPAKFPRAMPQISRARIQ